MNALARDYILTRIERLEKLVHPASKFEIEIGINEQKKFRVEVMVRTPHHLYRAEESTETAEGSINIVADKLENQIVSTKEKKKDLERSGARVLKEKLQTIEVEEDFA